MVNKIILFVVNQYSVIMQRNCPWLLVTSLHQVQQVLSITSNPEDGPTFCTFSYNNKKRKHYDKTFKLKVMMFAEKFSNREAERTRPHPRIEHPLEYNTCQQLTKLLERARSNRGNTVAGPNVSVDLKYDVLCL